ncbi:cache domain-containing sensor histidine kinase [Paenibacillus abyssi]|uniref:Histidine kinase n=1 Tax=Paenibacillus abyssi TaxID=1340531 RepID=A0A917G825_9BACL|nr:sensor histidine kinase [Paenibacillus abyssi]GGG27041.1 histidine kinase [Paenibacillus abyssi]
MKRKLIITFLPLTLIPIVSLTLLSSWIYSNQMKQTIDNNVINTVNLINNHLETYLSELTRLSVLPYYNEQILSIMQEEGSISFSDVTQIKRLLSQAMRNPREDLQSVLIYRRDGQIFASSLYNTDINYNYPFQESALYRKAMEANGRVVFTGKGNDSRIINRPEPIFSVARAIKIYNGPLLGVIVIDVNFTGLESIFSSVSLGEGSNIVVLDEDNEIVYSKNRMYLEDLPKIDTSLNARQLIETESDNLIVHLIDSKQTGWTILGIVSESEINHEKNIVYQTILMVSAVLIAAIVAVSILLSSTITKPLTRLRQLMRKVENGDFNVSYQSLRGNVEISLVGRAFNKMNKKIDELIHQVLEIRLKQKEAEINNLKLQIRPHFLFNNLEAIRALAEIGDRKGIVEITSALGGLLRYSLNKQNSTVKIGDEINQIKNYLKIEQIRSGNQLQVDYDLEDSLLDCYTIPILLQPVVENCILHGFDQISGAKSIRIAVRSSGEDILLEVADNGAGMFEEALTNLKAYLEDEVSELECRNFGIGLKNLHSRIQLEYGTKYGLTIASEHGKGMSVQILIPKGRGKESS